MKEKLLEVIDLKTYFHTEEGLIKAVDGLNFSLNKGEILTIVGESGCGKSITSLSVIQLLPDPPLCTQEGKILFNGEDLTVKSEREMYKIRGNKISMIFQEPMTSLNPVYTIGNQIVEAILLHQNTNKKIAKEKAIEMLGLVGIPSPEKRFHEYPHQLSGGMRQRVMIAMAVSCNPELLIADEPTTALDVTIQAQILDLMKKIRQELETSIIMITHDLGVVAEIADKVAVMYCGQLVEYTDVETLFKMPQHPYTQGLMNSIHKLGSNVEELTTIEGVVPSPHDLPSGCLFHPRCKYASDKCRKEQPPLSAISPGHSVKCFHKSLLQLDAGDLKGEIVC